jgi:mitochondrial fission protein ELM1
MTEWMFGVFVRPISESVPRNTRPRVMALIGGLNKAFHLDGNIITQQLQHLASRGQDSAELVVAFSRRTPAELERQLRLSLGSKHTIFIDRHNRSAYIEAMRCAREIAVTPDSITMICESFSTLRPVTVLDLPCFNRDTSTFRFVAEVRSLAATDVGNVLHAASDRVLQTAMSQHKKWLGR